MNLIVAVWWWMQDIYSIYNTYNLKWYLVQIHFLSSDWEIFIYSIWNKLKIVNKMIVQRSKFVTHWFLGPDAAV